MSINESLKAKFDSLAPHLNERLTRIWAGSNETVQNWTTLAFRSHLLRTKPSLLTIIRLVLPAKSEKLAIPNPGKPEGCPLTKIYILVTVY
jgi:hypothetical protein